MLAIQLFTMNSEYDVVIPPPPAARHRRQNIRPTFVCVRRLSFNRCLSQEESNVIDVPLQGQKATRTRSPCCSASLPPRYRERLR